MRELRRGRGLTQEAFALYSGINMAEVSRVERGVRDVRLSTLARFAAALEVTVADLVRGIDD